VVFPSPPPPLATGTYTQRGRWVTGVTVDTDQEDGRSFGGYASWWRHTRDRRFFTYVTKDPWTMGHEVGRAVVDDFGNLVKVG